MGEYSRNISERFNHTKIASGYCLICGKNGKLTQDHVPPQGSITVSKVEQRHIAEMLDVHALKVKGVSSPNGSKFKTICLECNTVHLGRNDYAISTVCKSLTNDINYYFSSHNNPTTIISTPVNAIRYMRAMIGHILSATSVQECKFPPQSSLYFDPLKQFVLGDDDALNETHDIYYWFYPYNIHMSAKCVSFYNEGHVARISILSFFPVAFMVTLKNEGTFPAQARRLDRKDRNLFLDLSFRNIEFCEFPFHSLRGNQMSALNDSQAIISYPIGQ